MNNSRKYIWSMYLMLWVYFIFFDSSYEQGDHIALYLIFGWVPFLILHLIWRAKKPTNNQSQQGQEISIDETYKLLFKVVDKKEVLENTATLNQIDTALQQVNHELEDFYKEAGHDEEFFKRGDGMLDLNAPLLEKYWKLEDTLNKLDLYKRRLDKYFADLDELNKALKDEGIGVQEAKEKFKEMQEGDTKELTKAHVQLELAEAISKEMIELKRKHGDSIRHVSVKGDDILRRLYEKHPEWKNT